MTIGRGTTPTLSFTFLDAAGAAIDAGRVAGFYITISQNRLTVVEKTLSDCAFDAAQGLVSCTLSQEDTLSLAEGVTAELQWRARLTDGTAIKSNVVTAAVDRVLKDEVI